MRFVVSLTILVVLLLLIPDGDAWRRRRRRRSSRRRRRWGRKIVGAGKKAFGFYKKHKTLIHGGLRVASMIGKDAETQIKEIANLKAQDHEAYDDYMQLLQDDLEMRFPEEDVSDMIASLNELADMQPDELAAAVQSVQAEHDDDDDEQEHAEDLSDEISE